MKLNISDDDIQVMINLLARPHGRTTEEHEKFLKIHDQLRRDVESDKDQTSVRAAKYRQAGGERFAEEGNIEVDTNAVVSFGDDNGAYVQMWGWVPGEDVGEEEEEEDEEDPGGT